VGVIVGVSVGVSVRVGVGVGVSVGVGVGEAQGLKILSSINVVAPSTKTPIKVFHDDIIGLLEGAVGT
jgi:hypothetical protein